MTTSKRQTLSAGDPEQSEGERAQWNEQCESTVEDNHLTGKYNIKTRNKILDNLGKFCYKYKIT